MTHFNRKLSKESGNIFFALFGAVALVGVVTAATSNLIAGPMTTSVKMNRNTAADANIATSAHLILAASAKAVGGDCDADGLTEPVAPVACATAPAGAGCIPGSTGSSKTDPWNTPFAYCAYDHGARDAGVCPGRLAGENPTGPVLIALISAGPDKVFQTTCADAPAYITRAQGSDDIIKTFSPALAMQVGGGDGVWTLDPSDQTTASTAKDLSINTEMTFASAAGASFSQDSRLDLGAGGLFFLPDQNSLVDGQCNAINKGSVRRKTSPTTEALEICSGSAWVPVGVSDFLALTDTPDSYAGKQGSFVRVDGAGLQFSSAAFLDLSDTPNTYAAARSVAMVNGATTGLTFGNLGFPDLVGFPGYVGNAGRILRINGAENAITASPFAFLSLSDVSATTFTGHNGDFVRVNGGSLVFASAGFLELRDTPNSFAGQAGKVAKVNSTANAIEFGNLNFTDLNDTPNSYAGQAGKAVVVNAAGTGLEFSSASGGGSAGPAGINGVDGSRWHSGLGIPAAGVGLNGDYYLNLTSGDVYLKASGSWAVQGNIKGSTGATGGTGATGLPGVNGVDGSRWYSGLVAPGAGTGVTGDYYLNTTTGDVYAKAAGAWSLTGNIKGADGLTGPAGSTSFIGLTDTPASFASHAGKVVAVNAAANALEFVTPSSGGGDSGMVQSTSFLEPLAKTPFATTCSTGGTITETAEQSTLELKSSATLASGCMLSTNRTTAIQIGQQEIMHVRVSELPFALMTEGNEVFIGWSGASMTQDIKTASGSIGIYADSTKPNWQILYRNGEISTAWTDTGVPYAASGVLNVRMTVTDSNLKVEIKSNSAATVTLNRSIAIGLDGYKPRRVFGRIKRNSGSGGGNSLIVDAASIAVKVATP